MRKSKKQPQERGLMITFMAIMAVVYGYTAYAIWLAYN